MRAVPIIALFIFTLIDRCTASGRFPDGENTTVGSSSKIPPLIQSQQLEQDAHMLNQHPQILSQNLDINQSHHTPSLKRKLHNEFILQYQQQLQQRFELQRIPQQALQPHELQLHLSLPNQSGQHQVRTEFHPDTRRIRGDQMTSNHRRIPEAQRRHYEDLMDGAKDWKLR